MLSIVGMLEGFACPVVGMPGAAGSVRSVAGMQGGFACSVAGMPDAAGSVRRLNVAKSSNRRFCHTVSRKFSIEAVVL